MKSFISTVFCLCLAIPAVAAVPVESAPLEQIAGSGPAAERAAIVTVLHDYLRVTDFGDRDAVAKSFHPTAFLATVTVGGALKLLTQDEWWERVSRIPAGTPPRRSVIALIEVVEAAAIARVDITDARGSTSTDLFTLLKTAQGWRIVNKVLSSPL
jgi:hypothetical protein